MAKVSVKVQSSCFGSADTRRVRRLRAVQGLGAELITYVPDTDGNVEFLVPEEMVPDFNAVVASFSPTHIVESKDGKTGRSAGYDH